MFGILQLGAAPSPSGLGLDPLKVGFLQLAFGLSMMIFGPVFGLLVAKRRGLNLKLLIPGIVTTAISFLLLLFFHSTSQAINGALFVFGIAGAFLPMTLTNTTIAFTPKEYTGFSHYEYDENYRRCNRSCSDNCNSSFCYDFYYCG